MATQKVHLQVALQKLACSYYMYIHLLCLRVKQDFRLVIELEIYLRGNARDAWGSSSFRDDLGLGKRRCGRTKLDSGRIVGNSESAGINRHVVGDERALQERKQRIHPGLESCR